MIGSLFVHASVLDVDRVTVEVFFRILHGDTDLPQDLYLLWPGEVVPDSRVGPPDPSLVRFVESLDSLYNDFVRPGLLAQILDGSPPKPEIDIATVVQVPGLRTMLARKQARLDVRNGHLMVCFSENPRIATQSSVADPDLPTDINGYRVVPKIWVESEVGKGSTFRFTLPLRIDQQRP